ncbi:sensor histidine kinase [Sphingobium sp. AN641]|uniref:sensor histidine kinase n=1 Tax=Sphingobium sp. AN641 TaxID=3133443 RepID=UPI0030BAE068
MFLILTLALLPLGGIALVASLQAIETADLEREALLRMAVTQSARKLAAELMADQAALQLTVDAFAEGTTDRTICPRARSFMTSRANHDALFFIYDRQGHLLCSSHSREPVGIDPAERFAPGDSAVLTNSNYLARRTISRNDAIVAITYYGMRHLERIADSTAALQNRRIALRQDEQVLPISDTRLTGEGEMNRVSAAVGIDRLALVMSVREPPATLARTLSLFLPMVMWFAAAAIGWFVVNRLLIRPLVMLRRAVEAYHPGEVLEPMTRVRTPAMEISALGDTFRAITEDVASHEAEMAASLDNQRKLTREVHHRVKNNLQIIASLINLHARAATADEAIEAYASIQRRVDALSVVHRNHFAELEDNRGVGVRALISELSASLRATAPEAARKFGIQIDSDDLHITQDVAVPVAFLVTELVELAMLAGPSAGMRITVRQIDTPGRACLTVASSALTGTLVTDPLHDRFDRVLTGLSRQLRAPLERDEEAGSYAIAISAVP